jgi:hypothetical protein
LKADTETQGEEFGAHTPTESVTRHVVDHRGDESASVSIRGLDVPNS